jgi:hypothetical protein
MKRARPHDAARYTADLRLLPAPEISTAPSAITAFITAKIRRKKRDAAAITPLPAMKYQRMMR